MEQLASNAYEQYKNGLYDKSVESLGSLSGLREQEKTYDPKIQHNLCLVNYSSNGCTEPKKFLEDLSKIKKKIEDIVSEQENATTIISGLSLEESDSALLSYNQAVVNLQLKQYATSLSILESLFSNIEPIDEYLAVKICFLLVDVYLILKQKDKVSSVITHLEKTYSHLLVDDPKDSDQKKDKERPSVGPSSSSSPGKPISVSEFRYNLHISKAKFHLLSKGLKPCKKEIKLALGTSQNIMSLFLKSNLEYLRSNYPKAIKLLLSTNTKVGTSVSAIDGDNSVVKNGYTSSMISVLYFNNVGCIHYRMKKYSAATHYLTKALKTCEQLEQPSDADNRKLVAFSRNKKMEILYNIGHQLLLNGNPEQAFQCFQQSTLLLYKQPKVWLRLAECCIAAHVKKLNESAKGNKNNLVKKVSGSKDAKRILLPTNNNSTEKGLKIREDPESIDELLSWSTSSTGSLSASSGTVASTPTSLFGNISLEFGAKCARNALFLISRSLNSTSTVPTPATNQPSTNPSQPTTMTNTGTNATNQTTSSTTTVPPVDDENMLSMKLSALANITYLALATNNPVVALHYARELISSKKCTDQFKYLGNIYAAEALCMLNKPNEALQHLNPSSLAIPDVTPGQPSNGPGAFSLTNSGTFTLPANSASSGPSLPSSPYLLQVESSLDVRYVVYTNLAVVHLLKDDLGQAQQCVTKALTVAKSTTAILLQVYLDLRKGNTEGALQLLKSNGSSFIPQKFE